VVEIKVFFFFYGFDPLEFTISVYWFSKETFREKV
jgi:hypothetical protein